MKKQRIVLLCIMVLLLLLLATSPAARAALDAFGLDWWTVDSGGGTSTGGVYSLSGTIGQPDAGSMSVGSYTLAGGFWSEEASLPPKWMIHLPFVIR